MGKRTKTEQFYGAQTSGETMVYDPDDLVLVTDPTHPLYDPSVNDPPPGDMVDGINELGVLEPILVRRNGKDKRTGKPILEVVNGRMRVKATRIANAERKKLGLAPILIEGKIISTLENRAESAMVAANEHIVKRSIVARAEMLERYLAHGHTEKQARTYFGRDYRNLRDVMGMSEALRTALLDKRVTFEIARELGQLPEADQTAALAATLAEAGGKGRGQQAKQAAAKQTGGKVNGTHCRTPKMVLSAIDTAACMPRGDYQRGVLDALEWCLRKKDCAWAGEKK